MKSTIWTFWRPLTVSIIHSDIVSAPLFPVSHGPNLPIWTGPAVGAALVLTVIVVVGALDTLNTGISPILNTVGNIIRYNV